MNRLQSLLVKSIMSCLLVILVGCNNKKDDDKAPAAPNAPNSPNSPSSVAGAPYREILNFAVGTFGGDCVSLSSGQVVPSAQVSLTDGGVLSGGEFTAQFSPETHVLSFEQKRDATKAFIVSGEWNGFKQAVTKPNDSLLLRFDSKTETRNNLTHARLEEEAGDKGWSCASSNTDQLISSDLTNTFSKYIEAPTPVFTSCLCTGDSAGALPVTGSATDFSGNLSAVSVQGHAMDLSNRFLEQMVSYYPVDQSLTYTLKPSDKELAIYIFDKDLKLKNFAAEFANGKKCSCQ